MTYPQTGGHFPTLNLVRPTRRSEFTAYLEEPRYERQSLRQRVIEKYRSNAVEHTADERNQKRDAWKRDLSGRANGTIDPFYGCFLFDEMVDYASNFSFPWSKYLMKLPWWHALIKPTTVANGNFDVSQKSITDTPTALISN